MSLSTRWVLPVADAEKARALQSALGMGSLAAKVLAHRGILDIGSARRFIEASLDNLHDPLGLRDMDLAAGRLADAIRRREKILIFGDYDVDGAVSVVLLVTAIELAGGSAAWRIPHRLREGYGMRTDAAEAAAAEGVKLIVSVDTGIRAADVVRRAAELGIDVIITDHHLPESELPSALAVLNPNRPDCSYPEKNLCGAGVAFKLAQALFSRLGWPAERIRKLADSFLKIVAIATIADVVPLTGENRIIVKNGLEGLASVKNAGLRALFDVAGFTGAASPSSRQVAFQIAPRINAAGRMDSAEDVINLFLTRDTERAKELALRLNERNAERQQVEAQIREACERVPPDPAASALVYYDAAWHRGVLGIVASRLVERFRRPAFVLGCNEEDGLAQGSGRGIPGFHLLEALESMSSLFVRFGGHRHAAGVTLEADRVPEFRERLNHYAAARLRPEDFAPVVQIDATVSLDEIDELSAEGVFALAPFGYGNPQPVFAALSVEIAGEPVVWKGKHLKVMARQNGRTVALKAWNLAARASELASGTRVDIAFSVEQDAYSASRGYESWCAILRDVRPTAQALQVSA